MLGNLNGWHLVIILAVVLLLFGAPKLPGLARSIGQSMRIFRNEVRTMKDEDGDATTLDEAADDIAAPEPGPSTKTTARKSPQSKKP